MIQGITIIIPCYNEAPEILANTIDEIKIGFADYNFSNYEILVVNDGSKKHTYKKFTIEKMRWINHEVNKGYGAALKTGISQAKYEWVGITDADGTYPNREFGRLIDNIGNHNMVVGARPWKQISAIRKVPKYILTKFASFLANYNIQDLNSGMRIFQKDLAMKFWGLYPNGFSFTSTITMGCLTSGYSLKYVPIEYSKREGKSHINPIKDTINFFSLVTRLTLYFNPMRVFIPLSMVFMLMAIGRGLRDYYLTNALGGLTLVLFFMAFQAFFFGLLAEIVVKTRN